MRQERALVEHPAVEDQVGGRFGGMYLNGIQQMVPEYAGTFVGCAHVGGIMVFPGQCQGMFLIIPLPKDKVNLFGCRREAGRGAIAARRKDLHRG